MDTQSTNVSDRDLELLSQLLDGELRSPSLEQLEQRLAHDNALRDTLESLRQLDSELTEVYARRSGIPKRIEDLLRTAERAHGTGGKVLPFPGADTDTVPATSRGNRWSVALAASLLVAAGVALMVSTGPSSDGSLPGNDLRVAAALDTLPSGGGWSELSDGRAVQPVLTFEHRDGRWCREYLLRGREQDWRAVACRDGSGWTTQAAGLESYVDGGGAYRPAGAADSAPVTSFISQNAADIALDREQEASLIDSGW